MDLKTQRLLATRQAPTRNPIMTQSWDDLLFLHWQCDPQEVQALLPLGLTVDTFDSKAYIGIIGFKMNRVRVFNLPALPWLSYFNELNVRVYVLNQNGEPGVYFLSLDCDRWPAVTIAKNFFGLNYVFTQIKFQQKNDIYHLQAARNTQLPPAEFKWRINNSTTQAVPGSLTFHLTERYNFYISKNNKIWKGQVHHEPYELHETECLAYSESPLAWNNFSAPGRPPDLIHACRGVKIKAFSLVEVDA